MSKSITLLGATYSGVPAVDLPQTGGGTARFIEPSDTTATASDVAAGKYFYTAAGVLTEGTSTGGGGGFVDVVETLPNGGQHHKITGVDLSNDTVTAAHLESGYTAHDAEGNAITGTLSPGGGGGGGTPDPCPVTVVGVRNQTTMGSNFKVFALSNDQDDYLINVGYVRAPAYPLNCYAFPRPDSSETYPYEILIVSFYGPYEPTLEPSSTGCAVLYSGKPDYYNLVIGCQKNAYVAIGLTNHN